jgi:hypothetical protein
MADIDAPHDRDETDGQTSLFQPSNFRFRGRGRSMRLDTTPMLSQTDMSGEKFQAMHGCLFR